jgi:hypothetical protein
MTTPTLDTVRAAFIDSASYESDNDAALARAFLTAARRLLVMLPSSAVGKDRTQVDFEMEHVRAEINACQAWLASNQTDSASAANPSVLYHDFSDFSDR